VFCVGLSACTVNYGFTGADIPLEARTFSVETFQVIAPLATPLVAQNFSETLRDLLQQQTPLDLVRERGHLQYAGTIVGYDIQPVNIQSNETAAQNRLTMTVTMRYTNTLDPDRNKEETLSRFADYASGTDLAAVEEGLITEIGKQLAQDIFDRSLGNW
jgi:Lipopolysaccharide-assembly